MKQLLILTGCVVLLSVPAGCQNPADVNQGNSGVEVIIEGDGEFPQFLVGKWKADKADKDGWEIVFEPDGTISSAIISLGWVKMKPGEVTTFPTKGGGKGVFEPGIWTIVYEPDTRVLDVQIVIDHFHQDLGKHSIEGSSVDVLTGPVSEDGLHWYSEWFGKRRYTAILEGGVKKEFPNMAEELEFKGTIVFHKKSD